MPDRDSPEVLAIIPARGGSKGIPRKNIRLLGGHPLVAYSIAAGLAARSVQRLLVSTDDEEIAAICRCYGADVPFLRPAELAQDLTPDLPVFQHAIRWLAEHEGYRPDIIVHLRPTSPLRPPTLIDHAVADLCACPAADSVRGIGVSERTPYKMWRIRDDTGFLKPLLSEQFDEEHYNLPRQALPVVYWHTGHIDVMRYNTLMQQHSMSGRSILPLVVESLYCADIDSELDWAFTEALMQSGKVTVFRPQPREEQQA